MSWSIRRMVLSSRKIGYSEPVCQVNVGYLTAI